METHLQPLIQFRHALYDCFSYRSDALFNLIDAVCSYSHQCSSVVELSNAPCFERQYLSIHDALCDGLSQTPEVSTKRLIREHCVESSITLKCYGTDCTDYPRRFSKTLPHRHVVHHPNPSPGNKPIVVGHQYSALVYLPQERADRTSHWVVPLSVEKVSHDGKGNEAGIDQFISYLKESRQQDEASCLVADSLYSSITCRSKLSHYPAISMITRLNSKRTLYTIPHEDEGRIRGRKKRYGRKMCLNAPETHPQADHQESVAFTTAKGKSHCWKISRWDNRGFPKYCVN